MVSDDETTSSAADEENEVDNEDVSGGGGAGRPWDASKIRITTKNFTLREVAAQLDARPPEIDLAPDFQRAYVWKERQRTRLVESILLGIPLPAFYFNQDKEGAYQVVDGVQRLTSIHRFMSNEYALEEADLEYLKQLAGARYDSMELALKRRFAATQIVVHVIEPQTPDELKYDIFSRVNTLGSPLSAQEIRHAMSTRKARDFLRLLVHLPSFDVATNRFFWRKGPDGASERHDSRMMDRELALRFCAFRITPIEHYKTFESLDAFLLDVTKRLDGLPSRNPDLKPASDEDLARLKGEFDRAMSNAAAVLEKAAFRKWPSGQQRRGPINRAIFEAHSTALHGYSIDRVERRKTDIQAALRELFADPRYLTAVTVGTGDYEKIKLRIEKTEAAVATVLL